ncbi:insulinase family protein [Paucibacter sp. KBW04]|uniref:M16 family metallopeptidase n=1 Tax=Paucibacter sp. KBW04 TaxID=2153361 RepID=UPI000F588E72|nr:pitrilysin family protein [Paucibacter sp. KBW04]RQO63508.1 insulinase family protein [Paucibacter sp. KBW04]
MHSPIRLATLALLTSLFASNLWAQKSAKPQAAPLPAVKAPAAVAAPEFLRELGGIEEYRLPNGLQVLLLPDATQTTTTVNITYRVGSRHESAGEYGMAHLLEHLLFKGTEKQRDIPGAMAQRGVGFNGTTTVDRTNYFASFNANADTLAFLLELEADRMLNSRIAKADLDTEMTVVRNEFERSESEPFAVLAQRVNAAAYAWHAYGKSTLGAKSDIENVPIARLQSFYKRYYRPDNATLLIAGAFDKAATLALISKHFGPLPKPATALAQPYTVEPAQDGERSVVVRRVGGQSILLANYHVPAVSHPDTPALRIYGLLMSVPPSGHLYKQLVETKLAGGAGLGGSGGADPGSMSAFAILGPDANTEATEKRLLDLVEGRNTTPFEESELARVRELAVIAYREQMKNPEALIQQISGLIAAGDWRLFFQIMDDLPKVTLSDVERVRAAYFRPANRTLGRYLPSKGVERVEIPEAPSLEQRLATLKAPPKVEEGERLDPSPTLLESRMTRSALPSGIVLHTLQKQTRGNTVQLQLQLLWGEHETSFTRRGSELIAQLLAEGSSKSSKQALMDALIKLRASFTASSSDQGMTLFLTAERDTLLPALAVVADVLRNPALPEAAFERQQKGGISALQASRREPETLRREATRSHYNQALGLSFGHPDYSRSLDDRIHALQSTSLDDLKSFHADYWSANEMRVSAVGALPEGLALELERLFGDWKKPAAPKFVRYLPKFQPVPAARFDVVARDKAAAIFQMQTLFPLNSADPDFAALQLAVNIFGSGTLESRLAERLRGREGLSYSVAASLSVPFFGNNGYLTLRGIYAPDQRDRVIAVVQEEILRMNESGITEAELSRAQKSQAESRRQARTDIKDLANSLNGMSERGETWAKVAAEDAAFEAVTVASANAAWRKYIRPDGFVISTAGDFK